MKNRNAQIDTLKGILVLLVIFGHSIQIVLSNNGVDYDGSFCFRLIYSFHMPLFMTLSGFIYSNIYANDFRRHFKRLLIPFFVWGVGLKIVQGVNPSELIFVLKDLLKTPDSGLWFLLSLFYIQLICSLFEKMFKNESLQQALLMVLALSFDLLIAFTGFNDYGFDHFAWMLPFFVLGRAIRFYRMAEARAFFSMSVSFFSVVLIFAFFPQFHRTFDGFVSILGFVGIHKLIEFYFVKYILAFAFISIAFVNLRNMPYTISLLPKIGRLSLEFYACQFIFFAMSVQLSSGFNLFTFFRVSIVFLFIFIASYILISLIEKVPRLYDLLFGKLRA